MYACAKYEHDLAAQPVDVAGLIGTARYVPIFIPKVTQILVVASCPMYITGSDGNDPPLRTVIETQSSFTQNAAHPRSYGAVWAG
jgi:hypothetical protein